MSAHVSWGSTVAANGCPRSTVTAQIIIYGINSDRTCVSGNMNARDQWWLRIYVGDQW